MFVFLAGHDDDHTIDPVEGAHINFGSSIRVREPDAVGPGCVKTARPVLSGYVKGLGVFLRPRVVVYAVPCMVWESKYPGTHGNDERPSVRTTRTASASVSVRPVAHPVPTEGSTRLPRSPGILEEPSVIHGVQVGVGMEIQDHSFHLDVMWRREGDVMWRREGKRSNNTVSCSCRSMILHF